MNLRYREFAVLFKKYRLRSEFETLSQFGDALSENGAVFENSIFSHWQKGDRTPKDRSLLIMILKIFIERGGITSLKEVNDFLEAAGHGYLTDTEIRKIKFFPNEIPFQVPSEVPYFTGRSKFIKKIKAEVLKGGVVLIEGPPGIGKTTLAIKLAHLLRYDFPDGILWYRLDTTDIMSILSSIALIYGENINEIKNIEIRASIVRSIFSSKKVLLVLDNAKPRSNLRLLLPNSSFCGVIITSKFKNLEIDSVTYEINLSAFTDIESTLLLRKILGTNYVRKHKDKLLDIAKLLGNLPLAINIIAKQILFSSRKISEIYNQTKRNTLRLSNFTYEDKDLYKAIELGYRDLDDEARKIFISLGIFSGKDFSIEEVSAINRIPLQKTENILANLTARSLVEKSTKRRYRLHPLIRNFARGKISNPDLYAFALDYYIKILRRVGRGNVKSYPMIEIELDNILAIYNESFKLNLLKQTVALWNYLGIFLWDTGRWDLVEKFGKRVYKAALFIKDKYAQSLCCIRELGWLYLWQDKISAAKKLSVEGLNIALLIKNDYLIAFGKQRLGMVYHVSGDQKKAYQFLKESLNLFKKLKEKIHVCNNFLYLGHIMRKLKKIKTGRDYYLKSLSLASKIPNQPKLKAMCMHYLGEILIDLGNFKKAVKYFANELKINIGINRKAGIGWSKLGLAIASGRINNIEESLRLFHEALEIFYQLGMADQVKRANKNLSYFIPKKMSSIPK